jgi:tartrate dehydrogenase/decarboxylase/D-malate dehydrogenase
MAGDPRYRLAVVPGDGIGPEVIAEGVRVLREVERLGSCTFELETFPWGAGRFLETGEAAPDDCVDIVRSFDAIYYGAVGIPDLVPEGSARVLPRLRQGLDLFVNFRPTRLYPGVKSPLADPGEIDIAIVRENTEGEYSPIGGLAHPGTSNEVAAQVVVVTRSAAERLFRYGFETARKRNRRKHVTLVTKSNAMPHTMGLWDRIFFEIAAEYPDITTSKHYIDAMTMFMIQRPSTLDVVVTSNLMGDILSEEAAAITGSIGLAASGNLNPERTTPSCFEPCHGSAPDIAGKGVANPLATIGAGALMLDWLGESWAADLVNCAVGQVLAAGEVRTPDLGGSATSSDVTDAVLARMRSLAQSDGR